MILWIDLALLALCFVGNSIFAGAETALYRVSRGRLELEARAGSRAATLARRLLASETSLVVTLVLGVNLCVEVATHVVEDFAASYGAGPIARELVLGLGLTPVIFFFFELLPKELCRRRPNAALSLVAPALFAFRWIAWPLERVLVGFTELVSRAFGLRARLFEAAQGREAVTHFLEEGRRAGAIHPRAETMARNALRLRSIPIERCAVAWKDVDTMPADASTAEQYARVAASSHTRLPVVDARGACTGYVHQLDVLGAGEAEAPLAALRPIASLPRHLSVDRALARLRAGGSRIALVGSPDEPAGIVTLKDLLEEISGDLAGW